MIKFYSENDFKLPQKAEVAAWISAEISARMHKEGEISFIFCNDDYLHKLNVQFLDHDTLTDIISFDASLGTLVNGEIYVSTERVAENAVIFGTSVSDELHRVIIHGILHFCGFEDKSEEGVIAMRNAENLALAKRTFV